MDELNNPLLPVPFLCVARHTLFINMLGAYTFYQEIEILCILIYIEIGIQIQQIHVMVLRSHVKKLWQNKCNTKFYKLGYIL